MVVELFCPYCLYDAAKRGVPHHRIDIPILQIRDDGRYPVKCTVGHESTVVLDNLTFELLFEVGIHAIVDGYFREAITSFSSSLETFYDFFIRAVAHHFQVPEDCTSDSLRHLSNQSERLLGSYVISDALLTKQTPRLLDPNSEVRLRNAVIHKGYIPSRDEAISFGNSVLAILDESIDTLRSIASDSLVHTYKSLQPPPTPEEQSKDDTILTGRTNNLITVDVRFPRHTDHRAGDVARQLERIVERRAQDRQMRALSPEQAKREYPDRTWPDNPKPWGSE